MPSAVHEVVITFLGAVPDHVLAVLRRLGVLDALDSMEVKPLKRGAWALYGAAEFERTGCGDVWMVVITTEPAIVAAYSTLPTERAMLVDDVIRSRLSQAALLAQVPADGAPVP
jgi:hypothetical protein